VCVSESQPEKIYQRKKKGTYREINNFNNVTKINNPKQKTVLFDLTNKEKQIQWNFLTNTR